MKARETGNDSAGEARSKVKGILANKSARLGKVDRSGRKVGHKPTISKSIVKDQCCGRVEVEDNRLSGIEEVQRIAPMEERQEKNDIDQTKDEMKEYLEKLQELVPFTPKNQKLSKLEVITSAIFYIRDLRETLGLPPCHPDTPSSDESEDAISTDLDTEDESTIPLLITSHKWVCPTSNPTTEELSPSKTISSSQSPLSPGNSPQNCSSPVVIKRQPLCVIASPDNALPTSGQNQRLSLKS